MRAGAVAAALLLLLVGGSPAAAQTDTGGLHPQRSYWSPEPWEHFDGEVGNIQLRFVDLVLPGNGGRSLAFQRTFSTFFSHGWHFGVAGLPSAVTKAGLPIGDTVTQPNHLALVAGGPQIVMSDGAVRQTFYVTRPTWQTGSHDWLTTEDHQTILTRPRACSTCPTARSVISPMAFRSRIPTCGWSAGVAFPSAVTVPRGAAANCATW